MKNETQLTSLSAKDAFQKLENKVSESTSEIIKWMFIFGLGQIVVLGGIIFAMLKLYF